MKMKKILMLGCSIIMACGLLLTGCGDNDGPANVVSEKDIEKNGIQMDNYLTLYVKGFDGYGQLFADIDLVRLKEDCSKFLVENITDTGIESTDNENIEDYLDYVFKDLEEYDLLDCDTVEKLSNGDVCEVRVEVPSELSSLLSVEVSPAMVSYTVKGLEKFEGIDPFEFATCSPIELVSVNGTVGYKLAGSIQLLVRLPIGGYEYLYTEVDVIEDKVYELGDTVHMTLSENSIQGYVEKYGEDVLTRTEADVELEYISYLPVGDNASEVFEYMDEACLDNVDYATKNMMDDCTDTDTTVERVGTMFFYDDEGVLEEREDPYKFYNELVFVYKITNDANPEGWYTYMAYNGPIVIAYELNKGTVEFEKCVACAYGSHLMEDYRYYQSEHPRLYYGEFPMTFECDGVKYPGHRDIADVFTAIKTNMEGANDYDHLIVTDELKDYVTEY